MKSHKYELQTLKKSWPKCTFRHVLGILVAALSVLFFSVLFPLLLFVSFFFLFIILTLAHKLKPCTAMFSHNKCKTLTESFIHVFQVPPIN